jgi:hypothetical protein
LPSWPSRSSCNSGAGNSDIDCVIQGPELEQLSFYAEHLRSRSQELVIIDADTTLKLNKPGLRVQIAPAPYTSWWVARGMRRASVTPR